MTFPAASARALACHSCRRLGLRTFISSIGGFSLATRDVSKFTSHESPTRRTFSYGTWRLQSGNPMYGHNEHALNDVLEEVEATKAGQEFGMREEPVATAYVEGHLDGTSQPARPAAELASEQDEVSPQHAVELVPWYLQSQHRPPMPQQDSPLAAARQQLPDLPVSPPAILQPLLEHVSVELGMDDLSLLDLRALDPPPALGANLVMIIGTARSEKHLHVSADRLCRWLRGTHSMRPFADGLLGRNELKLKMRRKAKRSRLLSAVGAKSTNPGDVDDGIRTGWVCVNLGRVEDGELPEDLETLQRAEGFVGFGARSQGCRIVVQMMTEEKRGDIDLEKLWTGIIRRAEKERKNELTEPEAGETVKDVTVTAQTESGNQASDAVRSSPASSSTVAYHPVQTFAAGMQHARAYHSSARCLITTPSHASGQPQSE